MKKLLIVVDYQKDFVDGSLGFDDAKKLDDYISYLIDSYHKNNDDVLFTFDTHHDNYLKTQEGQHLPVVHCLENSEGWKLYGHVSEKIKPEDKCMYKPGFGSLELGNYLHDKSYQQITLVGIVSNICVISNALLLRAALYNTTINVVEKACAGVTKEKHLAALETMRSCQINVL